MGLEHQDLTGARTAARSGESERRDGLRSPLFATAVSVDAGGSAVTLRRVGRVDRHAPGRLFRAAWDRRRLCGARFRRARVHRLLVPAGDRHHRAAAGGARARRASAGPRQIPKRLLGLLIDFEQVIRIYVMSTYVEQRRNSTLAGVDDAVLRAAVAGGLVEAVEEAYDRRANALYRLALLIVGDCKPAEDAVVGAFIAVWRAPSSVDLGERSVRGALAGKVYIRWIESRTTHELRGHGSRLERSPPCHARSGICSR